MFFWNSLAFCMTQWMLAVCYLIPLPLWNPACTSGSSQFLNEVYDTVLPSRVYNPSRKITLKYLKKSPKQFNIKSNERNEKHKRVHQQRLWKPRRFARPRWLSFKDRQCSWGTGCHQGFGQKCITRTGTEWSNLGAQEERVHVVLSPTQKDERREDCEGEVE